MCNRVFGNLRWHRNHACSAGCKCYSFAGWCLCSLKRNRSYYLSDITYDPNCLIIRQTRLINTYNRYHIYACICKHICGAVCAASFGWGQSGFWTDGSWRNGWHASHSCGLHENAYEIHGSKFPNHAPSHEEAIRSWWAFTLSQCTETCSRAPSIQTCYLYSICVNNLVLKLSAQVGSQWWAVWCSARRQSFIDRSDMTWWFTLDPGVDG